MKSLADLRKKHEALVYRGYRWEVKGNALHLSWDFLLKPDISFQPRLVIEGVSREMADELGKDALDSFAFNLGMAEIPSYWKAACPRTIEIEAGFLDKSQLRWWQTLLMEGMGEFFYRNKIDFTKRNFVEFSVSSKKKHKPGKIRKGRGVLIPVGGGKDAAVTLELLSGQEPRAFLLNPTTEQKEIARVAQAGTPIIARRTIDPTLLELNRKGYLNGHTPFSSYLAFLSVFAASLFGISRIAISQERSSNEGNAAYKGKIVNHQWSKTYAFERMFREYAKKHLAPSVEYFSFLRPLYEVQIAKIFSGYPQYFSAFLSCNEAHKMDSGTKKESLSWCGRCPKCLFVFLSLYPFAEEESVTGIFGKNLFEDRSLIPLLEELAGFRKTKPFECVGTRNEVLAALYLALQKKRTDLPVRRSHFEKKLLPQIRNPRQNAQRVLAGWDRKNAVPLTYQRILRKALER